MCVWFVLIALTGLTPKVTNVPAERQVEADFRLAVAPLIEHSCASCHDGGTSALLNLQSLSYELQDEAVFAHWQSVFDRVTADEMPPPSEPRPDVRDRQQALSALKTALHTHSLQRQQLRGRVQARRLTKRELKYTLQDLLQIDHDVTGGVPDEVDAGSFDTVGAAQRISDIHMESYLAAANAALDAAIVLTADPRQQSDFDFLGNPFMNAFHDLPIDQGGSVTLPKPNGVALFVDADYLTRGTNFGFFVKTAGRFRITSKVGALQSDGPVIAKLIKRDKSGGASLLKAVDITMDTPQEFVVEAFLSPGDDFYLTMEMNGSVQAVYGAIAAAGGAKGYKGPGVLLMEQSVEGPLHDTWPPASTTHVLGDVREDVGPDGTSAFALTTSDRGQHVRQVLRRLAPLAFRRPVSDAELDGLAALASPDAAAEPISDAVYLTRLRAPLIALLSSPRFLMFRESPGRLDDHALACRLSYFLWRSLPDAELRALADAGRLSDPAVLRQQTERLLDDDRAARFFQDFVGQWLRLDKVNATTPDARLYPEWDELLNDVVPRETEFFFRELVTENLTIDHLIDSDFTFVNRRLAQLYDIPDVRGQHLRKIRLSPDSLRGGVLTQAAILKTTANGTATSPVVRGNFVLSNLLGTPPAPPPPEAGAIEPDTSGRTTIREILTAHRSNESCQRCHQHIDPPGFALEAFDPIGRHRTWYQGMVGGVAMKSRRVDSSGTIRGQAFADVREYKRILRQQTSQIARHFTSCLVVFATGGEIQFADREVLDGITQQAAADGYRVRDLIHATVQSRMFRHK
ncbi:MAG: DUF1592 domain-containing protein [Planctomycetaceae bacterium]|nr:DUF1592 domain-containing protein [Planctomycetaceae bacterium]